MVNSSRLVYREVAGIYSGGQASRAACPGIGMSTGGEPELDYVDFRLQDFLWREELLTGKL